MTLLIKNKQEETTSFCSRDISNAGTYLFICKCVIEKRLYGHKHNYVFLGKYICGQTVDSSYACVPVYSTSMYVHKPRVCLSQNLGVLRNGPP